MKILEKIKPMKEKAYVVAAKAADKLEDAFEEHGGTIMMTLACGGLAIYYGQLFRYMHYLNREAKQGVFHWTPLNN